MPLRSGMLLNISSHAAGEDHGPVGIMAVIGIGCKHTSLSRANDASEIWHALKTQDRMLQMRIMAVIGIGCKSVRFLMQMMTQDRMLQMRIMARRGAVTCFPVGGRASDKRPITPGPAAYAIDRGSTLQHLKAPVAVISPRSTPRGGLQYIMSEYYIASSTLTL